MVCDQQGPIGVANDRFSRMMQAISSSFFPCLVDDMDLRQIDSADALAIAFFCRDREFLLRQPGPKRSAFRSVCD